MRNFRSLVNDLSFNIVEYSHIWAWILRIEHVRAEIIRLIENSCLLSPCPGEKQYRQPPQLIQSQLQPCNVTTPTSILLAQRIQSLSYCPRDYFRLRRRTVQQGGANACALRWGGASAHAFSVPSPPFLFPVSQLVCGPVWWLLPVGQPNRASQLQLLVMSYGPLDMYWNPGPSGPQLRDFSSIIQTCSGNIQRISQASKPGDRAGGQSWGARAVPGTGLGEAAVTWSPFGAAAKASPEDVSGFPLWGRRAVIPESCQARTSWGSRAPAERKLESLLKSYALMVLVSKHQSWQPQGGSMCVCHLEIRELIWCSGQPSLSPSSPTPRHRPPPLFPVWPVCIGSCLLI